MTPEELLRKRVIVENLWPACPYVVGEILYKYQYEHGNYYYGLSGGYVRSSVDSVEPFPYLMRPLSWWEERRPEEMPRYVKHKNGEVYEHRYKFDKEMYWDQLCGGHWIGWTEVDKDFDNYTPITLTEYQSYINKIQK